MFEELFPVHGWRFSYVIRPFPMIRTVVRQRSPPSRILSLICTVTSPLMKRQSKSNNRLSLGSSAATGRFCRQAPASKQMPATAKYGSQRAQRSALLNDMVVFMRKCARKARRNSRLRRMVNVRSRYFLTVNGTENPAFSHIIFSTPPPAGFGSRAIVNWPTVLSSVSFFKSIRASSFVASSSSL